MKRMALAPLLLIFLWAPAQMIRTILPHAPVPVGTAFQVQYIVTDPADVTSIGSPAFGHLELVSGPNRYRGNAAIDGRTQPIENITYTLVAREPGVHRVGGLHAQYRRAGEQHSSDTGIVIVPAAKASFHAASSYTDVNLYAPPAATDRARLAADNLFVRATADHKTCYAGEPVVLQFKLYSRLQSTSEVTNVPALYGFSMIDMLDAAKSYPAVETIDGQVFNTSVLRKLQLYGGQAGNFVIEGMDIQSEIEFDEPGGGRKIAVRREFSSPPITLTVKALPGKAPADYTGAVGRFSISASLVPDHIATNEAARLLVLVRGTGNFIQFAPPSIEWPRGLSAFEPEVGDSINVQAVPEAGKRTYAFRLTADSAGSYTVPPISFSFFDPAAARYETVTTAALPLAVYAPKAALSRIVTGKDTRKYEVFVFAVLLLLIVLSLIAWRRNRRPTAPLTTASDLEKEWDELKREGAREACIRLDKLLRRAQREGRIGADRQAEWQSLLDDCQLLAYSSVDAEAQRGELLRRAGLLLRP